MKISHHTIITKIHLVISVIIVIAVAFVYGFNPSSKFNIFIETTDEHNFFKATMGLYLAFSIQWIFGILKLKYLKLALITNIIFMLGLGFGRIISWFIDGTPSLLYCLGTFGELIIGCYGLWVCNSKYLKKP